MALANYTDLKTAIATTLNRDDLAANVPDFIALAEADLNRRLRHWRMQKRSIATIDSRYSAVPSDWLESVRFTTTDSPTQPMEVLSQIEMAQARGGRADATGRPAYFAVTGGQFEFFPTPNASFTAELVYYARVPVLSDSAPVNFLLTEHPDVYLYGALAHSAPFLREDDRVQLWSALYVQAVEGANGLSERGRFSGPLRMKIKGLS